MRRSAVWYSALLITVLSAPLAWAATYTVDKDHSTVEFKIRHLLSYTRGSFTDFAGTIEYEPSKPETWKADATIQAASIDTNQSKRDAHLRSPDFFDVEKFPTLTFVSTQVTDVTDAAAKVHGDLTIHGVTKPVVFDVVFHGVSKDPWGNVRAGFTASTMIDRKDFGLTWNQALEAGQVLVGEEVEISLEIEGIAK